MKTKIQTSIMRIICGWIPLFLLAFVLSVSFQSCQQDEFLGQEEMVLKTASFSAVTYPDLFGGPETFVPAKGKLQTQTWTLTNVNYADYGTDFAVIIRNGEGTANKVMSATVIVNGIEVAGASDFRKGPEILSKTISGLGETTTIDVQVKGKAGSYITIWIEGTLIPEPLETFVDSRDNKSYKIITIGTQVWMAENLAYLPSVSPPTSESDMDPFYYVYDYSGTSTSTATATANYSTYGVLYNWPAALTACPSGWHLPIDAEWTTLSNYLIENGYGYGGSGDDIAKSMAAKTNWTSSSTAGTPGYDPASNNSSGFSALPGGHRYSNEYSIGFASIEYTGSWWSSTEYEAPSAWFRFLTFNNSGVSQSIDYKKKGSSVRCVRD